MTSLFVGVLISRGLRSHLSSFAREKTGRRWQAKPTRSTRVAQGFTRMSEPIPRRGEPEVMDDLAEAQAYAAADFADVNEAFVARLLELAGPPAKARAVDLGTGPGDIPIRLVRARPGWHVTAVEASQAMLNLARQAIDAADAAEGVELVEADAKATGLPGGAFDVVFSNSILHHITQTEKFWSELKRLAAPGAVVLIRDLVRPRTAAQADAVVRQYAGGESDLLREEFHRSLLSAYSVEEVRSQLARAGLDTLALAMVTDRHLDVFGRLP